MYNLKNVENILGGVILLVKLQVSACNLTIFTFFKLYKCYQTCKASHLQERDFFFSSQTVFSGLIRTLSFIKNFWMKIDYINIFFFHFEKRSCRPCRGLWGPLQISSVILSELLYFSLAWNHQKGIGQVQKKLINSLKFSWPFNAWW